MAYSVFTRTWWKDNPNWPNGLEPCPGKKTRKATVDTAEQARAICQDWNARHKPGRYSLKAEFEEI